MKMKPVLCDETEAGFPGVSFAAARYSSSIERDGGLTAGAAQAAKLGAAAASVATERRCRGRGGGQNPPQVSVHFAFHDVLDS